MSQRIVIERVLPLYVIKLYYNVLLYYNVQSLGPAASDNFRDTPK